ncbi:MAG: aldo/keto reductase [Candidatus Omnitrophica bacterium]|nr:aldo/keto reductase [Candidatus Omnitrophota bacterium]
MEYRKLANAGIEVSSIALGTWVFGGDMWGGSDEEDCIKAVCAAIDMGVNLIDTAPIYGFGRSEMILGKALKGKREKVILATKCGLIREGKRISNNLKPESIIKELDESLKRLQTDYIDIYQCHWPDPKTPIRETMACLERLKDKGKIKFIGVSNFDAGQLEAAFKGVKLSTTQNQYSILERKVEEKVLPTAIELGIGMITYGGLGGGILTGKYDTMTSFKGGDARSFFYRFYTKEDFPKIQKLLDLIKEINKPLNQTAINWVRAQKGIASVIVGCRNEKQANENISAAQWDLESKDIEVLRNSAKEIIGVE